MLNIFGNVQKYDIVHDFEFSEIIRNVWYKGKADEIGSS